MAQPQPNMQRLANSLHDAGKEFALLNNLPGLQNNDQLQIITAQLQVIMNRLENIENNQQVMRNQLQNLNNAMTLIPMRLTNATSSINAPLSMPPGIAPFPITKANILSYTGVGCDEAANRLGVAFPQDVVNVRKKRQYLTDYLGGAFMV